MSVFSPNLASELFWDSSHLVDVESDAFLVKFPAWENITGWLGIEPEAVPDRIYFDADFKVLEWSDFPSNNVNWPLASKRMLDVLLSVGPFPHRLIPVILLDYRLLKDEERFDPEGNPRPGAADDRFAAVQITEYVDAFDWERSEYVRHEDFPQRVFHLSKLVLKEPPGGFPPLFRISAAPMHLFVSADARRALEHSRIRGIKFWPLENIRY